MKSKQIFAFILALCIFMPASSLLAQAPSLAASDQYVVTVDTERGEETYTIIRDGRIEEQFYYLPIRPMVAVKKKEGKNMPVFQLMSYQVKDKKDELKQGGILQMSMVMGVPQKTVDKLLKKVKKIRLKTYGKRHRLSPMPIKKAELTLYDMGGDMLDQASPSGGIAPTFGTQHYPFMLKLKDLGADMMKALCTKNGGLPVLITYTYQGMTPKAGFEVEVNWDACYKHFSTDIELCGTVAKSGISGGLGLDISVLREKFESEGLIKITSLANETVTSQQLDQIMGPVLNLITMELFEQIHAPKSIPPAEAAKLKEEQKKAPIAQIIQTATEAYKKLTGKFFKVGVKVDFALKDAKIVKKGKFTYKFDRQAIVDRTSSFGGLLGIGDYPKATQDKCITTMPAGNWEAAYFVLPTVGDPESLGIDTVDISVTPQQMNKSGKWEQISGQKMISAGFNKKGNQIWTNRKREEISRFLFPLKSLYDSEGFKKENCRFKIDTTIKPETGKSLSVTTYQAMFNGDLPIAPPTDLVDTLTIDGSCLTFGREAGEVFKVIGQIKAGKQSWKVIIDENKMIQNFLVPTSEKGIQLSTLNFVSKKGRLGQWTEIRKNLRDLDPSLYFMLFDYDWTNEPPKAEKLPENTIIQLNKGLESSAK